MDTGFKPIMVLSVLVSVAYSACPCSNTAWCQPVVDTDRKEVFVFSVRNNITVWGQYDWTKVTTVAMAGYINTDLMCLAHKHNTRVVMMAGYPTSDLTDAQKRHIWVQTHLKTVANNYLDGINIDFEGEIPKTRVDLRDGLTALVSETFKTFKHALPHSQVTMDVPYGPGCVYNRCYDYPALSLVVDFFFIMDYDEWGGDLAGPSSGFQRTSKGLSRYLDAVPSQKLLLGAPWYGFKYKCETLTKNDLCKTSSARTSMPFSDIYRLLSDSGAQRVWNKTNLSPFFNCKEPKTNDVYQIWYDDPESLLYKYALAARTNLRGVGVFHADCVDYDNSTMSSFVRQWILQTNGMNIMHVKEISTHTMSLRVIGGACQDHKCRLDELCVPNRVGYICLKSKGI